MRGLLRTHGRAYLLLPWIGWILGLAVSGGYRDYVAGWHIYLQVLGLVILGFTFIGEVIRGSLAQAGQVHGPDCAHGEHAHSRLSLTLVLAHLVPMVLYLAVGPATLSLQPQAGGGLESVVGDSPPVPSQPPPQKLDQEGYLITDLAKLNGQLLRRESLPPKVRVVGQIFTFPPDQLEKIPPEVRELGVRSYFFRFVMTCCAADARPVAAALLDESRVQGESETWFELKGQPMIIEGQKDYLALRADKLKQVPKPADPYLFSFF